ncbi:hypothetical protein JW926_14085 [Candidatus Sumerlaeota bacterium]|nr:hypothetical protein [Candidatus Sumerlaeota bacterium]
MMDKQKAYILGCDYIGLAMIQELGRHSIPVRSFDNEFDIGSCSRYGEFAFCPDPAVSESDFIDFLINQCRLEDEKPIIFPVTDLWSSALAKHKDQISKVAIPCVADWETLLLLIDKREFSKWGMKEGFPVPRGWSFDEILSAKDVDYPVMAKPITHRKSSDDPDNVQEIKEADKFRIRLLSSKEELLQYAKSFNNFVSRFFFQEYVPGLSNLMYSVGVYADQSSKVRAVFTGRKVRGYPAEYGDCMVGQVDQIEESVIDMVAEICRKIKLTGMGEFEFKSHPETEKKYLIEINPGGWTWINISPFCDVSVPFIAYQDLCGVPIPEITRTTKSPGEVKHVRILYDLPNCLYKYKKDGHPEWSMGIFQWLESIQAKRIIFAEFTWDDLKPFLFAVIVKIKTFFKIRFGKEDNQIA